MKLHQAAQQKYKTDIKHKVTRQVQIVKPDATGEEVDAVMRSEGGSDQLYKDRILAGGVNDQIKGSDSHFFRVFIRNARGRSS
jgi:t-SNARE complex subunit (syntaxin)